jgi:hypothetical protein
LLGLNSRELKFSTLAMWRSSGATFLLKHR